MYRKLKQSCHEGLTRIEISYYPQSRKGESALLQPSFHKKIKTDLTKVFVLVNQVEGVCWPVPNKDLFEKF